VELLLNGGAAIDAVDDNGARASASAAVGALRHSFASFSFFFKPP